MLLLYDLIFLIFAICYLPVFLFKKKIHAGFGARLGFLPEILKLNRPIWIHAVSVGEVISIKHLLENLKEKFPGKNFVISTVTPTGNKIARSIAGKNDLVLYSPLDFSWIVRGVIAKISPSVLVITETEIWPNLIQCLYKNNIPIVVVNARISDQSFNWYLLARFLFKPLLRKISVFCAQTDLDAERLVRLGVSPEKITRTGNMKFDIKIRDGEDLKKDYFVCREKLGLGLNDKLFVAASTHSPEEDEILKIYLQVSMLYPDLKLLIAPRHPERSENIEKLINKYPGVKAYRISSFPRLDVAADSLNRRPVFILDVIGELMYFYLISDIVFVGGSLVKKGGHNILEPASLGKPILFGKYMFNFRDITRMFLNGNAGIMAKDSNELKEDLIVLLSNKDRISQLGKASREIILKNQGATAKNVEVLDNIIKEEKWGR